VIIIKNVKKNPEGGVTFTWSLSDEQLSFLVTYAINHLLNEGLISIQDVDEGDITAQHQLDLLDGLDETELPQA
jgi:hypothetical protein